MELTKNSNSTFNLENLTIEEVNAIYDCLSIGGEPEERELVKQLEKQATKFG